MILAPALEETEICRMKKFKSPYQVDQFKEVIAIIQQSRSDTLQLVNKQLIQLYWEIGKFVHIKITQSEWGVGVVSELAQFIQNNEPDIKGFSDKNIWRMRQFYECYKDFPKLSPL